MCPPPQETQVTGKVRSVSFDWLAEPGRAPRGQTRRPGPTSSNRRLPAPRLTALRPKRPLSGRTVLADALRSVLLWNPEQYRTGPFRKPRVSSTDGAGSEAPNRYAACARYEGTAMLAPYSGTIHRLNPRDRVRIS